MGHDSIVSRYLGLIFGVPRERLRWLGMQQRSLLVGIGNRLSPRFGNCIVAHDVQSSEPNSGAKVDPEFDATVTIYSILVEMADRVSLRRQAANSFYLSINTALIGGAAFLSAAHPDNGTWVLGVAGVAICCLWVRNISSYKTLNNAKFKVIQSLEERLPIRPYTDEWKFLTAPGTNNKHKPFHSTEIFVPYVFIVVYIIQIARAVNLIFLLKLTHIVFV